MKEYKSLENLALITKLSVIILAIAHTSYFVIFYILDMHATMYFKLAEAIVTWLFVLFTFLFKADVNFSIYYVRANLLFSCSVCNYFLGLNYGFLVVIVMIICTGYVHNFKNPSTPKLLGIAEALVPSLVALLSYDRPNYVSEYQDLLHILGVALVSLCTLIYAILTEQINNKQQRVYEHNKKILRKNLETDKLTKLYNRATMQEILSQQMSLSTQELNSEFALALIDVDNFKKINEQFGRRFGDVALRNVAEIIKTHIESNSGRVYASRWSGQEFLIGSLNCAEFITILEGIRKDVSELTHTDGYHSGSLSISVGACINKRKESLDSMLGKADTALYNAKRAGGNCLKMATLAKESA